MLRLSQARGPDGRIKRGRWAVELRKTVTDLISDMETWQNRLTQYISLMLLTGYGFQNNDAKPTQDTNPSIKTIPSPAQALGRKLNAAITANSNTARSTSLHLQALPAQEANIRELPHSLLRVSTTPPEDPFIVESRYYLHSNHPDYIQSIIQYTAHVLSATDAHTMHVLACKGYVHHSASLRYDLILQVPSGLNSPRSLRDALLHPDFLGTPHSISERLRLAKQIASAALYMHAAGLVHKNIRPETILLFRTAPLEGVSTDTSPLCSIGTAFLVGYDSVRKDEFTWASALAVPTDWEIGLYMHPARLNPPIPAYTMEHDIYSMGIVLLELALGRSLITWDDMGKTTFNPDLVNEELEPGELSISERVMTREAGASEELRRVLVGLARQEVPCVMGDRFAEVVVTCLEVGREGEENDEADGPEEEGLRAGFKYIETVLDSLDRIVM